MIIILEGPDCSGKSTLAGRLIESLRRAEPDADVRYLHSGPPTEHPLDEYTDPLRSYRPGTGVHYVCDRWHVGEHVYPRVTGRRTDMTEDVRAWLELFLRSRGALLVHCDARDEHLLDCAVARDDEPGEVGRVPTAAALFRRYVAGTTLLPSLVVDVSDPDRPDYVDTVDEVVGYAAREARAAAPLAPYVTYVGPSRPTLLLVGDRRGTPRHDIRTFGDLPAFVPATGTSGAYLMSTLTLEPLRVPTHGVQLRDVGLVNACDVDDVRACWETVGRPTVVGLGVNARRALRAAHVPHRPAVHPQYQRRFLHHNRGTYLRQLLDLDLNAAVTA
jgi:hypothetical protein